MLSGTVRDSPRYPDPEQRRAYFRKSIDGKPLTDANLRLAHLRARALEELGRRDEALEVFDTQDTRFARAVELRLRASTAGAARERAEMLVSLGRERDAEAALDRVVGRLEGSVEHETRVAHDSWAKTDLRAGVRGGGRHSSAAIPPPPLVQPREIVEATSRHAPCSTSAAPHQAARRSDESDESKEEPQGRLRAHRA